VVGTYQIGTGLNSSVEGAGWGAGLWGGTNNSAFQTTIAEDLDASETGVDVATGQGSNFANNDVVLVGSELMTVSSVATDTLTVARGILCSHRHVDRCSRCQRNQPCHTFQRRKHIYYLG
jgi:hypothetical protein